MQMTETLTIVKQSVGQRLSTISGLLSFQLYILNSGAE
jgi:hypothetical protein